MTKTFSIRLPSELLEKIKMLAKVERRSVNAQVIYMLEMYLRENP